MANPAIVLAPPGLGGPPAAPAPAVAPPAGAPGGAREGAAMEVERHDIASNNEDDSANDGGARGVVLRPNLTAQVQAMEGRIQSLEDTVQELTALVVDLQASQANLLERNLRGERSPPPS